jgi:hypothetical protein
MDIDKIADNGMQVVARNIADNMVYLLERYVPGEDPGQDALRAVVAMTLAAACGRRVGFDEEKLIRLLKICRAADAAGQVIAQTTKKGRRQT